MVVMLHDMENKSLLILAKRKNIRTHPNSRDALEDFVRLAKRAGLRYEGKSATQEALVNASWLYLAGQSREWLAANLGPYLKEIEKWTPVLEEQQDVKSSSDAVRSADSASSASGPLRSGPALGGSVVNVETDSDRADRKKRPARKQR